MQTEVHIYTAADAFLYLPVYIAKELKIFDSLIKDNSVLVKFVDVEQEGDIIAIKSMLKKDIEAIHNKRKNIIPICISDPIAFLSKGIGNDYDINQCVVIGALINKIPFWAVNHNNVYYDTFEQLCSNFTDVVHYDKDLLTGYYLGKKFKSVNSECDVHLAKKVGSEFKVLNDTYQGFKERGEEGKNAVAITADIVTVVKGLMDEEKNKKEEFSVNYYFSKGKESLISTGILTTQNAANKRENHRILCKIIEGIQKSISILECSEEIASDICLRIANEKKIASIDINVARKIIERINDENFYPADLNINKDEWDNSIIALGKVEQWNEAKRRDYLSNSFAKHINNSFLKGSLKEISNQFGITKEVFRKEINDEINSAILPLSSEIIKIKEKYGQLENWDRLTLFMAKSQVRCFNFFKRPFSKKNSIMATIIWFVIIILLLSLFVSVIIEVYKIGIEEKLLNLTKCMLWLNPTILALIFAIPSIKDWILKIKEKNDTGKEIKKML